MFRVKEWSTRLRKRKSSSINTAQHGYQIAGINWREKKN